jgi:hypothetical protein
VEKVTKSVGRIGWVEVGVVGVGVVTEAVVVVVIGIVVGMVVVVGVVVSVAPQALATIIENSKIATSDGDSIFLLFKTNIISSFLLLRWMFSL